MIIELPPGHRKAFPISISLGYDPIIKAFPA
jgi:hypothetical protein